MFSTWAVPRSITSVEPGARLAPTGSVEAVDSMSERTDREQTERQQKAQAHHQRDHEGQHHNVHFNLPSAVHVRADERARHQRRP
jgi:hypothetical protein